ncbi:hypothetical protein A2592_03235 [Candidatus Kaiserbacteria bacterium RIFOXYD1_FULL_42_15]|uniref:Type II toxin-antitoxin system mRNA interferase toxin, RelE/StbE family n=2 Tax=Candidatus Kaiseribacteriota TaxID=1752734 RepID=A0A2M8FFE0_9BACT|nr:MAG: hypothetical protein A2592_03235 [Candidatus Kaiserbacteria bacterium RIFOXYD1_FULL_42_15]PJC56370.1 MAG: hypothetical protein CO026_00665 [Candidatus Kaiserbacteria bacterium CG_4_9_14_0_2_um_filter_41_32]
MHVLFSKTFTKTYKRLDQKIKKAFEIKLLIFIENEFDETLRNHSLQGKYDGVRSITITGDFRAHYVILLEESRTFVAIGTHSELYEK